MGISWCLVFLYFEITWFWWNLNCSCCIISSLWFKGWVEKNTKPQTEFMQVKYGFRHLWNAVKFQPFLIYYRRLIQLGLCVLLYSSLWLSYLYFNAEMTDSSGESIKFRDGVANFLTSPLWTDFKQTFKSLISSLWTNGWYETWKKFMDDLDPLGEQQALKVNDFTSNNI